MDPDAESTVAALNAAITSHIDTLRRHGRADEVDAALTAAEESARAMYSRITSDGTRTVEWQRQQLAQAYRGAVGSLARKLAAAASGASAADRADAAEIFGLTGVPGDLGALSISRRDAADRVQQVTDRDARRAMLAQATRVGDEVMARAIVEAAMREADIVTVNQFEADRPDKAPAIQRLWDALQAKPTGESLLLGWRVRGLVPDVLAGRDAFAINALAAQAE